MAPKKRKVTKSREPVDVDLSGSASSCPLGTDYMVKLDAALETVKKHPLFEGIASRAPLTIQDGASIAPFSANELAAALANGKPYRCFGGTSISRYSQCVWGGGAQEYKITCCTNDLLFCIRKLQFCHVEPFCQFRNCLHCPSR